MYRRNYTGIPWDLQEAWHRKGAQIDIALRRFTTFLNDNKCSRGSIKLPAAPLKSIPNHAKILQTQFLRAFRMIWNHQNLQEISNFW